MIFSDYVEKYNVDSFSKYMPFMGVVEDNADNLAIGRVRVRCFGIHPEDRQEVPTEHLPWALVAQPTTSASISGLGSSPNGLELGSWVIGYFADGEHAQYPIVTHTLPGIHRPNAPGYPGGSSAGWLTPEAMSSGGTGAGAQDPSSDPNRPYHGEVVETPPPEVDDFGRPVNRNRDPVISPQPNNTAFGTGASIAGGNADMILTLEHKSKWASLGLPTYDWTAAPNGYACKDGMGSLKFHYGTALAFEKLTKEFGKGKLQINSAYRTQAYNDRQPGAAKHSLHIQGRALDISFRSIGSSRSEQIKFAKLAVKNGFVGFGLYPTFMHIDTGTGRTWNGASAAWFKDALTEAGWYPGKKGLSDVSLNPGATDDQAAAEDAAAANGDSTALSPTGNANADQIKDYMARKGYSPEAQAAVLASAENESGFNPTNLNPNDAGQPSYGLFQWRGDRYQGLIDYSRAHGTDYRTVDAQMDYFQHEMDTSHASRGGNALRGASSAYDANAAMARFEAYQGYNNPGSREYQERLAATQKYLGGGTTGIPNSDPTKGFVDPTNSLPYPSYRGTPSTHVNATGMNTNINQSGIFSKDAGRMTGMPAAGDIGTFGEPELAAAPQYPYNHTYATKSGHLTEFDDTPGSERLNIEHKSGSGIEIFADGQMSIRSKGNKYETNFGDTFVGVMGKYMITSVNDMHIRSTADMTQQADGSVRMIVGNDGQLTISGDYSISIGEDIQLKAGGRVVIQGSTIDLLSDGNFNAEAKGDFNIKGAKVNIDSEGEVSIKGSQVNIDDVVRMAEGLAKGNEGADTADVGPAPPRTTVNKDNMKGTTNSQRVITTEEAAGHYSGIA